MRSKRPQVLGPWLVGWWRARHGVLGEGEGEGRKRVAGLADPPPALLKPRRAKLVGVKNGAECIGDR